MQDKFMTLLSKSVIAILVAATFISIDSSQIYARDRDRGVAVGIAAGIIGLGVLSAAEAEEQRRAGAYCYKGPKECEIIEPRCFYNDFGDRICPAPVRRCYRREICD